VIKRVFLGILSAFRALEDILYITAPLHEPTFFPTALYNFPTKI
jgi:hypothetical protein